MIPVFFLANLPYLYMAFLMEVDRFSNGSLLIAFRRLIDFHLEIDRNDNMI